MGIGALHLLRSAPYYLKRVIALLEKKVMNWEKSANYFFISVGLKQKVRRLGQHEKYFTTHLLLTKQQSGVALEDSRPLKNDIKRKMALPLSRIVKKL